MRTEKKLLPGDDAHLVTCPSARPLLCSVHVGCSGQLVKTVRDRLAFRRSPFNGEGSCEFGEGQMTRPAVVCVGELESFCSMHRNNIWELWNDR